MGWVLASYPLGAPQIWGAGALNKGRINSIGFGKSLDLVHRKDIKGAGEAEFGQNPDICRGQLNAPFPHLSFFCWQREHWVSVHKREEGREPGLRGKHFPADWPYRSGLWRVRPSLTIEYPVGVTNWPVLYQYNVAIRAFERFSQPGSISHLRNSYSASRWL